MVEAEFLFLMGGDLGELKEFIFIRKIVYIDRDLKLVTV